VQALLQQNPSTHWPLAHIAARVQAVPCARLAPHTRGFCVRSQKPDAQSVSAVHELEHAVPVVLQLNGVQFWVAGNAAGQTPLWHSFGG
jgi:phospholipase C